MSTAIRRRGAPYRPDPQVLADASIADPETRLQLRVIDLAARLGWRAYHTHDSRRSVRGFPDLVLVKPPRVVFVELKVGRKQLTDSQRAWMADLERCSEVDAFVLRGGPNGDADLEGLGRRLSA
jgi:hypothetical protein